MTPGDTFKASLHGACKMVHEMLRSLWWCAGREQVKRDLLYRDFYTFLAQRKALQAAPQGAHANAAPAGKTCSLPSMPRLQPQLALA